MIFSLTLCILSTSPFPTPALPVPTPRAAVLHLGGDDGDVEIAEFCSCLLDGRRVSATAWVDGARKVTLYQISRHSGKIIHLEGLTKEDGP